MQKAKAVHGASFVHLWVSCPAGHKSEERNSVKIARLAVETGVFPLYEVENGVRYTINHQPRIYEYYGVPQFAGQVPAFERAADRQYATQYRT